MAKRQRLGDARVRRLGLGAFDLGPSSELLAVRGKDHRNRRVLDLMISRLLRLAGARSSTRSPGLALKRISERRAPADVAAVESTSSIATIETSVPGRRRPCRSRLAKKCALRLTLRAAAGS